MLRNICRILCSTLLALVLSHTTLFGQAAAPGLHGQVLDPSGAAVPGITVNLAGPAGANTSAQTDDQGRYAFRNLVPGTYTLTISLKGFHTFEKAGIVVARGQPQVVNAQLAVEVAKQEITVTETSTKVTVNPDENASALVIKGKDLEALSDDPDELQSELEALAGPSAGPNGGQIYIDGFTGGQLPPKSSIREVRVNQNPFSAQYDTLGYGRIEILTKPGTDKLHGQLFATGNDSDFNTRNPFAGQIPGYHSEMVDGNVGGPLNHKTSFYVDAQHRDIEDDAIVNAVELSPTLSQTSLIEAVPTPQTRTSLSPRLDTQFGNNNTLSVRYQLWQNHQDNANVGQFTLPSAGYDSGETYQSIQASDAQVINEKAVTELRFRYGHGVETQTPFITTAPTVSVLGAFVGGAASSGTFKTVTDSYEVQEYNSVTFSRHFLKFGGRFRDNNESYRSTQDFNGVFTFPSIGVYQIAQQSLQDGLTPAQIVAAGGGASQFIMTVGNPLIAANYFDFEPYVEDDWKARANLTISGGARFETQNHIHDHADFAPRLGLAWGLGKDKNVKTVLRAGFGIFYDRFSEQYILNAAQLNGLNQMEYLVPSPDFYPDIPPVSTLAASALAPSVYQIAPNLRTPYTMQSGIGLERQVTKSVKVSATYLNTHGIHQLITRDINAPDPAIPGDARPNPNTSDIFQYESAGLYNQNQLIANFNIGGRKLSLFGFYTLSFADSDTAGGASFPMNQYDLDEDYGRSAYDVRNRLFLGGSWNLPKGFQIFPFIVANSAPPLNITLGQDYLGGDYLPAFNGRPAFASSLSSPADVLSTRWGTFDTVPQPGEKIIPINYGTGYDQFTANLRVSKTLGFGKEVRGGGPGGGGPGGGGGRGRGGLGPGGLSSMGGGGMFNMGSTTNRRYNLTFSISARNIFNNINYAAPEGDVTSPLFGKPYALTGGFFNSSAANRRIDFQVRFSF